ncbi:MAG: F0F1 ATP synthase subunit B [Gemmatimonadales bacterium]|nr:F0F1 ATP synthase subunit B [Gemmatimonadales bacterium]MDZ4388453.1 F0F1 ATP synthase subunit B [Gemmatimonadales bacterium]
MTLPLLLVADTGGGLPGPFQVNFGLTLWTWLVFLTVLFILSKKVFPLLLAWNVEREQLIATQLAEAERLQAEAVQGMAEQRELLAAARGEAQAILTEARQAAEHERATAIEKTRAEQEELLARARREIGAERERAVAEVRREAVEVAIAAAGRVIGQKLDAAADRKIVEDYLTEIGTRA